MLCVVEGEGVGEGGQYSKPKMLGGLGMSRNLNIWRRYLLTFARQINEYESEEDCVYYLVYISVFCCYYCAGFFCSYFITDIIAIISSDFPCLSKNQTGRNGAHHFGKQRTAVGESAVRSKC